MKSLLMSAVLLSGLAQAEVQTINVKDFNFSYKDPHGEGTAVSFSRSLIQESGEVHVSVDKLDKNFKLMVTGSEVHEFELANAPSVMTDAETMSVKAFNLNMSERLAVGLGSGEFNSRNDSLSISGLSLDCNRDVNQKEEMNQLINGCIQKMSLKTSKFSSDSLEEAIVESLEFSDKGRIGISGLDLRVTSGKFELGAEVKAQINGKVRAYGNSAFDATTGKLTIKITEVKFGFLNITGKVFDELKKKESEKMKVSQPYVYISLK